MLQDFPKNWLSFLKNHDLKKQLLSIEARLEEEIKLGKIIFPKREIIFRSLQLVQPDEVKVVILGQDPYHNFNQADGLAFSVSNFQSLPPSLINIFIEIENDLNIKIEKKGDLENIAKQGVLLLNSILTVEKNNPGSHKNIGWEKLTDIIISSLSLIGNIVFILWGNFAKKKSNLIDNNINLVINSSHPSPFSAHKGFFGSKPFSKCNDYLTSKGKEPIKWNLK
ncbi:uracil-DNA glycosylase [SAR86 cluster bacterium]|nr:uracil-DNA glycosylase [SAR86 cluster bacterium]